MGPMTTAERMIERAIYKSASHSQIVHILCTPSDLGAYSSALKSKSSDHSHSGDVEEHWLDDSSSEHGMLWRVHIAAN